MRDLILSTLLVSGALAAIVRPWIGIIIFAWISIMNPHRLTYGFAYDVPWAQIVVVATFLGILLNAHEIKRIRWTWPFTVFLAFTCWQSITYPFSIYPEASFEMWTKVLKINLMIVVTIAMLQSRKHLEALVWVLVLSLGYYGVKGGIFTLLTGGVHRVQGPAASYITGNNELGLALVMITPLVYYLSHVARLRTIRYTLLAVMVLCVIGALGTQSRGAMLAAAGMIAFLCAKSPRRLALGLGMVFIGAGILAFMPDVWWARMSTILDYEQDESSMGRINAWQFTWNVASEHFFGGGYQMYTPEMFAAYAPNPTPVLVAHSIYFSPLGEHGYVGLALFLLLWLMTWREAGWPSRHALPPDREWAVLLCSMVKVSVVGYLIGGTFASLTYFDLPYYLMAIILITRNVIERSTSLSPAGNVRTELRPITY
jgi:probable O-glycosylation ligase (exosortase A-associated)